MSAGTTRHFPPDAFACAATSSSLSRRRPASTTVKPAFISASAEARPIPLPAPVTIAIFSAMRPLDETVACRSLRPVGRTRDVLMRGAQRRRPALAQVVVVGLARLDAIDEVGVERVGLHHHDVD